MSRLDRTYITFYFFLIICILIMKNIPSGMER